MKNSIILFLLGFLVIACAPNSGNAVSNEAPHVPALTQDWMYHRCPDQEPVKGCALELPTQWDIGFELQSDNAGLLLGNDNNLTVQIAGNHLKKYSTNQLESCQDVLSVNPKASCLRKLRFEKIMPDSRVVSFSFTDEKSLFTYYIFTIDQIYFIRGTSENGDPTLLDTSVLNVRLSSKQSSSIAIR